MTSPWSSSISGPAYGHLFGVRKICLTGTKPPEGFYCGVGRCNIFGCNCDSGCLKASSDECFERCSMHGEEYESDCHKICGV